MATFKIVVQKQRKDGFWPVYIRITHNRGVKYIRTDKIVNDKGIDRKNKEVKDPYVLQMCATQVVNIANLLNKVNIKSWSIHDLASYLEKGTQDICFSDFARKFVEELENNGVRGAKNYRHAYLHLEKYAASDKVMFSQLTTQFIGGWIKSLSSTAAAKESYPGFIKRIFNQALIEFNNYDEGIIRITTNPWPKVKIPRSDVSRKRAITMEEVRTFFTVPLPSIENKLTLAEIGRDVAMMVLCLAGINAVDLYSLKKEQYKNGIIAYERTKTRKVRKDKAYFEMQVPGIILPLFEKYFDKTESLYLFNFHQRFASSESFSADINKGIKRICRESLHMASDRAYCVYTFRHTWATVAQNECGASIAEVAFALNHTDKFKVTRRYIKIDFSPAWKLNEKVVEKIFFTNEKSKAHQMDENIILPDGVIDQKDFIKGTLFYGGKVLATIEEVGFNNSDEVIEKLIKLFPGTLPASTMVQIRIENKDKGQTQDYSRMV